MVMATRQGEFDLDRNGALNRDQTYDDGDLLSDSRSRPRSAATPASSTWTATASKEIGYETSSAKLNLNDDENDKPTRHCVPVQHAVPGTRGFVDAEVDDDGDALTLEERVQPLEVHVPATADARVPRSALYSDGQQYSAVRRRLGHNGRRAPAQRAGRTTPSTAVPALGDVERLRRTSTSTTARPGPPRSRRPRSTRPVGSDPRQLRRAGDRRPATSASATSTGPTIRRRRRRRLAVGRRARRGRRRPHQLRRDRTGACTRGYWDRAATSDESARTTVAYAGTEPRRRGHGRRRRARRRGRPGPRRRPEPDGAQPQRLVRVSDVKAGFTCTPRDSLPVPPATVASGRSTAG